MKDWKKGQSQLRNLILCWELFRDLEKRFLIKFIQFTPNTFVWFRYLKGEVIHGSISFFFFLINYLYLKALILQSEIKRYTEYNYTVYIYIIQTIIQLQLKNSEKNSTANEIFI